MSSFAVSRSAESWPLFNQDWNSCGNCDVARCKVVIINLMVEQHKGKTWGVSAGATGGDKQL